MTEPSIEAVARELLDKFGMNYSWNDADSFVTAIARFTLRYANRRVRAALEGAAHRWERVAKETQEEQYVAVVEDLRRLASEVVDNA